MIWFLIVAGLLTVAALAILLGPVIRQPRPGAEEEETVATLFRRQLAAIDEELTEDRLTPHQAEASRAEITRRMLAAADREPAGSDAQARRASRISWRFGPPIAVAGLLPAAAMAVYFAVGTPAAINRHAGLDTASSAGSTAGATSGPTRMPPSASQSANVPATKASGRRAAASPASPSSRRNMLVVPASFSPLH